MLPLRNVEAMVRPLMLDQVILAREALVAHPVAVCLVAWVELPALVDAGLVAEEVGVTGEDGVGRASRYLAAVLFAVVIPTPSATV